MIKDQIVSYLVGLSVVSLALMSAIITLPNSGSLIAQQLKVLTTLNDATTNAINAVGGSNSSTISVLIHPENGFLIFEYYH